MAKRRKPAKKSRPKKTSAKKSVPINIGRKKNKKRVPIAIGKKITNRDRRFLALEYYNILRDLEQDAADLENELTEYFEKEFTQLADSNKPWKQLPETKQLISYKLPPTDGQNKSIEFSSKPHTPGQVIDAINATSDKTWTKFIKDNNAKGGQYAFAVVLIGVRSPSGKIEYYSRSTAKDSYGIFNGKTAKAYMTKIVNDFRLDVNAANKTMLDDDAPTDDDDGQPRDYTKDFDKNAIVSVTLRLFYVKSAESYDA